MPTNRQRRTRARDPDISDAVLRYLETGARERGDADMFVLQGNPDRLRALWRKVKKEILADWIQRTPCSRPWAWWQCDAPRKDTGLGAWFEPLPVPRRQLAGVGQTTVEVDPATVPTFDRGIPDFAEIDEDDPPMFESEAEYLRRHGFLTPAETKYLAGHPELLEPEVVTFDEDE